MEGGAESIPPSPEINRPGNAASISPQSAHKIVGPVADIVPYT